MIVIVDEGIIHQNLCSLEIEAERHLFQSLAGKRMAYIFLAGRFAIQQQESAAACAGNLAAQGAIIQSQVVQGINSRVGNFW